MKFCLLIIWSKFVPFELVQSGNNCTLLSSAQGLSAAENGRVPEWFLVCIWRHQQLLRHVQAACTLSANEQHLTVRTQPLDKEQSLPYAHAMTKLAIAHQKDSMLVRQPNCVFQFTFLTAILLIVAILPVNFSNSYHQVLNVFAEYETISRLPTLQHWQTLQDRICMQGKAG